MTPRPVDAQAASGTGPSDTALVARLAVGDERALAVIYDRHSPLVYGLARRVTGSGAVAEEIAQEVFVFLWQHPDRFDAERGTLRAFLGAMTHRRAVDHVRRETRRQAREEREASDTSRLPTTSEISDGIEMTESAQRVRAAVDALPADQRDAVLLAYFNGFTFRDVAARLGLPEGTAKSRLRLGMSKLALMLRDTQ